MKTKKLYEYLTTSEWFGSLEKGCRLYYDFEQNGYTYHTEYENNQKTGRYNSLERNVVDYFISLEIAEKQLAAGNLIAGPELGELEPNTEGNGK